MNNSKQCHEQSVTKPQKPNANAQKSSTIYFQIGLVLCLLGSYTLLEMQFKKKEISITKELASRNDLIVEVDPPNFTVEVVNPKPKPKSKQLTDKYIPKEDNKPEEVEKELLNVTLDDPSPTKNAIYNPNVEVYKPEEEVDVKWAELEFFPVYPGCEKKKRNVAKKKCMSDKIGKLIQRKFNTDVASDSGLYGKQRVNVQFRIDKNGHVTNVEAKALKKSLEKEAKRVIKKIPKMEPAKQRNKNVSVLYSIPIWVQIE